MKKVISLSLALAGMLIISSCTRQEYLAGIKLDKSEVFIAKNQTATLTATLISAVKSDSVTWVSSDPAVATVEYGVITAKSDGQATIYAQVGTFSASCRVCVVPQSLTGTNYYIISVDDSTANLLKNRTVADFRPGINKLDSFLIWESTYTPVASVGTNFFGRSSSWISLQIDSVGWSGAHFLSYDYNLLGKFAPVIDNPDNYYLHIGIKSSDNAVFLFGLMDQTGLEFGVGDTAFNDRGKIVPSITNFTRNGQWQEIEVPLTKLNVSQLNYTKDMGARNVLWFLTGDHPGLKVDIDALYIYKKM